mgnify:FL=1
MKKKFAIVTTIFIACTITIAEISNNKDESQNELPIVRKQENLLSFYIENDDGEYEQSSASKWPTDGYKFNSILSKCENGGELSWDDTNKSVVMTGNTSDKCYIYFDIAKPKPKIIGISNIYGDNGNSSGFSFDITYESEVTISNIYVIYADGEIEQGRFTINNGLLSAEFGGWYVCKYTDYQIYIVDSNGTKSDNFSFQYTYTCFPAETKILTKNGYKNIEKIKVNDVVYSFNEITQKIELKSVLQTFIHEDTQIYNLHLDSEIIKVTPHHRFYIFRNNKFDWIEAKDLLLTDKLFNNKKELININKIENKTEINTVYNFEVQKNHTYFVSDKNILVHNAKSPC